MTRILYEKLDPYHMGLNDIRAIDGYAKPFNFIMSAREWGKSTAFWLYRIFASWLSNGKPWIYLTRSCVEINDALIDTIFETNINKWIDEPVKPQYKAQEFKDGIVDVNIDGKPFIRIVSLSVKLRRIKLATLRNCGGVFMDEYIIDPRSGEKYLPGEAFKIKEAYTTWRRECDGVLRCYFVGNPYSLFNPLFLDWEVDSSDLVKSKGGYLIGEHWLIRWANLPKGLIDHILEVNPLYKFDDAYTQYALEGNAINDMHIPLCKTQPEGYSLRFAIRSQGKLLGIYRSDEWKDGSFPFWVTFLDALSSKRTAWTFDLSEMVARTAYVGIEEKMRLSSFKDAMRLRNVSFSDVSAYYLMEEIFKMI